ncbi:hypothetical protein PMIN01_06817 [Paraphaeosphaeria minitans]|uniref:Uncharacterized protein n=1 Tax=Paraphaeosphaeria minitans TaxID=565426 RepID=A0A9P6KQR2_9PLEO|nr:hypothetical protein PMIN01_06817 [Paraphaeosphaeria minitans]
MSANLSKFDMLTLQSATPAAVCAIGNTIERSWSSRRNACTQLRKHPRRVSPTSAASAEPKRIQYVNIPVAHRKYPSGFYTRDSRMRMARGMSGSQHLRFELQLERLTSDATQSLGLAGLTVAASLHLEKQRPKPSSNKPYREWTMAKQG